MVRNHLLFLGLNVILVLLGKRLETKVELRGYFVTGKEKFYFMEEDLLLEFFVS